MRVSVTVLYCYFFPSLSSFPFREVVLIHYSGFRLVPVCAFLSLFLSFFPPLDENLEALCALLVLSEHKVSYCPEKLCRTENLLTHSLTRWKEHNSFLFIFLYRYCRSLAGNFLLTHPPLYDTAALYEGKERNGGGERKKEKI